MHILFLSVVFSDFKILQSAWNPTSARPMSSMGTMSPVKGFCVELGNAGRQTTRASEYIYSHTQVLGKHKLIRVSTGDLLVV